MCFEVDSCLALYEAQLHTQIQWRTHSLRIGAIPAVTRWTLLSLLSISNFSPTKRLATYVHSGWLYVCAYGCIFVCTFVACVRTYVHVCVLDVFLSVLICTSACCHSCCAYISSTSTLAVSTCLILYSYDLHLFGNTLCHITQRRGVGWKSTVVCSSAESLEDTLQILVS